MYTPSKATTTKIKRNMSYQGERIEDKIDRIKNNKEPITDGAPLVYTERKDGVRPEYDIRTDRWGIAIDAMDKVNKSYKASREQRIGEKTYDTMNDEQQKAFDTKFPKNKHAINKAMQKKADESGA